MGVADDVEAGGGGGGGDDDTPSWQLGKPRPLSWHTVACKITDVLYDSVTYCLYLRI